MTAIFRCFCLCCVLAVLPAWGSDTISREADVADADPLDELKRVAEQNPNDIAVQEKLAYLYLQKFNSHKSRRNRDAAIEQCGKILSLDSKNDRAKVCVYDLLVFTVLDTADREIIAQMLSSATLAEGELPQTSEDTVSVQLDTPMSEKRARRVTDKMKRQVLHKFDVESRRFIDDMEDLYKSTPMIKQARLMPPLIVRALYLAQTDTRYDGKSAKFEKLLKKALKQDPQFAATHLILSDVYGARGDSEARMAEIEKALSVNPQSGQAYQYLGDAIAEDLFSLECPVQETDKVERAVKAYLSAVTYQAEGSAASKALLTFYNLQGEYGLQLSQARRLYEADASQANGELLAKALLWNGQWQEADTLIQALQSGGSLSPSLMSMLSLSHHIQGHWFESAEYAKLLLGKEPGSILHAIHYVLFQNADKNSAESARMLDNVQKQSGLKQVDRKILGYLAADVAEDELLSSAQTVCEQARVNYLLGFEHLLHGRQNAAKPYFERVIALKSFNLDEYMLSLYAIKQTGLAHAAP